MICPTCGKAQLTERPHMHPSARRSGSVRGHGSTGERDAARSVAAVARRPPEEPTRHNEPGTCTACGQTPSHGYHRKHGRTWEPPYHPFYPQPASREEPTE